MRAAVWPLCLASVACGVTAPKAVAEPRKAEARDAPLIQAELKDPAEIARAFREHYTKYEYRIPMRDGIRLHTAAYVPKDRSKTYPILLNRTPYSVRYYGADRYPTQDDPRLLERIGPSPQIMREGYIIVYQDVRGTFMSEGNFEDIRPRAARKGDIDESTDTYDTVDWLVKNAPANSGKVGLWGISYPGFYAAQGAIDAHPAMKAVSPQAPVTEWFIYDDFHHNGVFFQAAAFDFFSAFAQPHPKPAKPPNRPAAGIDRTGIDAYDFFLAMGPLSNANTRYLQNKSVFWNQMMEHGTRDEFWKARDPRPHYKNVKPAVMTVGGWYDAEDPAGPLETYRAFERQSPGANNTLVMGPWSHGGWIRSDGDRLGDVTFGAKTSHFFREHIELPFFQRYLKGKQAPAPPEAWVYETGTNIWQRYAAWPPAETQSMFVSLHPGGKLSSARVSGGDAFDAYVSDPAKPVPYRDRFDTKLNQDFVTEDQRFASRRPDVLTYSSPELDADVTLAGPIEASLWVSTTGTDADFVVKVIDVYPEDYPDPSPNPSGVHMGGYQQLVRGEIMRGKFRTSFEKPVPFKPGEPALVRFALPDILHTFRSGHRLMVQIQSSWFPVADRNPQVFTDIYRATEKDFQAATHRVYHTPQMPSGIKVGVLRGKI